MASYGYNRSTVGWIEERREKLLNHLEAVVGNLGQGCHFDDLPKPSKQAPTVQDLRFNSSSGIYIHNIQYLKEETKDELFESADEAYLEVMMPELNGRTYLGVLMPEVSKGELSFIGRRFRERELERKRELESQELEARK